MDLQRDCQLPLGGRPGIFPLSANTSPPPCFREPTEYALESRAAGQHEAVERVLTESHVAEQLRSQLRSFLLQRLGAYGALKEVRTTGYSPVGTAGTKAGPAATTESSSHAESKTVFSRSQPLHRPPTDFVLLPSYLRQECATLREKVGGPGRPRPAELSGCTLRPLVCLLLECLKKRGFQYAASILQPEAGLSEADLQSPREICAELKLPQHLAEPVVAGPGDAVAGERSELEPQDSLRAPSLLERVITFARRLSCRVSEADSRLTRDNRRPWRQDAARFRSQTVPPPRAGHTPAAAVALSRTSSRSCCRSSSSLAISSSETCCNYATTRRGLTGYRSSCGSRSASEPSRCPSSASLGRCCSSKGFSSASKCSCSFDSDASFHAQSDGTRGCTRRCYSACSSETDTDGCSAKGCRTQLQQHSLSRDKNELNENFPSSVGCLPCKKEKRTARRRSVPPTGCKEGRERGSARPAVSDRLRRIDEEYKEKLSALQERGAKETWTASCSCSRSSSSCSSSASCCSSRGASGCSGSLSSCSCCGSNCSSGTDLGVRMLRYERECEDRHRRQLQNELFRVRTLEASAVRLEEGQKARQHLLSYKNELDRLHSERVTRLKFQEEAAAARLRKKENEIEQKGYALRQEISAQLRATQQLQRDNKRQWEVEHHALEVRAKALDAREARIQENEERQNQDGKLNKQQLHLRMEEYKRSVELDMQEKVTQLHKDRLALEIEKQRVELASEQLTKLQTDVKRQAVELDQLQKTVKHLESTAEAEKQAKEQLQESMRLAGETADRAKAQMSVYETEIQCLKRENASLQQQLSVKHDSDHESRHLHSRTMDELHGCLRDSRQTCQDLERKIALLQDEIKRLIQDKESAVSAARRDVERLYSEGMDRLKAELKQEQSATAAKEKELVEARSELERLSALKLEWQQRAQKLEAAYKASATSREQQRQLVSTLSATLRLTAADDEVEPDTHRADFEPRRRQLLQNHLPKIRTGEFYCSIAGSDATLGSKPVDVPHSPERRSRTPNRTPSNSEAPSTAAALPPLSSKTTGRPATPLSGKDTKHYRGTRWSSSPDGRIADLEDRVQRFIQSLQNADKLPLSRGEEASRRSRRPPSSGGPANQGSPHTSAMKRPPSLFVSSARSSPGRWSPASSSAAPAVSASLLCPFSNSRVECASPPPAGSGSCQLPQTLRPPSAKAPENAAVVCRSSPPRAVAERAASHHPIGRERVMLGSAVRAASSEATSCQQGFPEVRRANRACAALQTFPTKSSGEITDSDITNLIGAAVRDQDVPHAVPSRRAAAGSWKESGRRVPSETDVQSRNAGSSPLPSRGPNGLLVSTNLGETGKKSRFSDKAPEQRSEPCLPQPLAERPSHPVAQTKTGRNKGLYLIRASSVTGRLGDEAESSVIIEADINQENNVEESEKTPGEACASIGTGESQPSGGWQGLRAMETRQSDDDVEEGEIRDGETVVGQQGRELIADQMTLRPAASPWLRVVLSPQQKAKREDTGGTSPLNSGTGGCAPEDERGAVASTTTAAAAASQHHGAMAEFASQTSFFDPAFVPPPEPSGFPEDPASFHPQALAEVSPVRDACAKPAECSLDSRAPSRQGSSQAECVICRGPSSLNSPHPPAPGHSLEKSSLGSPGLLLSSPSNQFFRLNSSPGRFAEFSRVLRASPNGADSYPLSVSPVAPAFSSTGCPECSPSVPPSPLRPVSPLISRVPSREASSVPLRDLQGEPAELGEPAMDPLREASSEGRMLFFSRAPSPLPVPGADELAAITLSRQSSVSRPPGSPSEPPPVARSSHMVSSSALLAGPQRQVTAAVSPVPLSAHVLSRLGSSFEGGTLNLGAESCSNPGKACEQVSPWYNGLPPQATGDVHSGSHVPASQDYIIQDGGETAGLSPSDGAGFLGGDEIVAAFVPTSDLGIASPVQGASTLVVLDAADDPDTSLQQGGMELQRPISSRHPPLSLDPGVAACLEPGELVPNHLFNMGASSVPFPQKVSNLCRSDSTPSPTLRPPSSLLPSSSSPGFMYPLPPRERTPASRRGPLYTQAPSQFPIVNSEELDLSPTSPAPISMQATLAGVTPLPLSNLPSAFVPTLRAASADLSPLSAPVSSCERHLPDDPGLSTPAPSGYPGTAEGAHPTRWPEGSLGDCTGSPNQLSASKRLAAAPPTACCSTHAPRGVPAFLQSPRSRTPGISELSPAVSRAPSRQQLSPYPSSAALLRPYRSGENGVSREPTNSEKCPLQLHEDCPANSPVKRRRPSVSGVAPPSAPVSPRESPTKRLPLSRPGAPASSRSPSPSSLTSALTPRPIHHLQKDRPPLKKNRKSPPSPQPASAVSPPRYSPRQKSPSRQQPPQWQLPHLPLPLPPGYPTETAARAVSTYNRPSATCSVCSPISRASDLSPGQKVPSPRSSPRTARSPNLRECRPGSRARSEASPSPREGEQFSTPAEGSPTSHYEGPPAATSNRESSANTPTDREQIFLHPGQIIVPPGGVTIEPVHAGPEHSIIHPLITDDTIAELTLPLAATSYTAELTELQPTSFS